MLDDHFNSDFWQSSGHDLTLLTIVWISVNEIASSLDEAVCQVLFVELVRTRDSWRISYGVSLMPFVDC